MQRSRRSVTDRFSTLHERLVLRNPGFVLLVCAIVVLAFGWFAQEFNLDATADSLTLERDADLRCLHVTGITGLPYTDAIERSAARCTTPALRSCWVSRY